jgi:hypothetical protein
MHFSVGNKFAEYEVPMIISRYLIPSNDSEIGISYISITILKENPVFSYIRRYNNMVKDCKHVFRKTGMSSQSGCDHCNVTVSHG